MTIGALNERFGIAEKVTVVAGEGGLAKIAIEVDGASAEIYLHGAQVTSWKPDGAEEVIFLSERSRFENGKAIRGGIPICFPWFRAKEDDARAPAHGVVRTKAWELVGIEEAGGAVVVTLATESDDASRAWWPYAFRVEHRISVGKELGLALVVSNTGSEAFHFAEALHTYHRVGNVQTTRVEGLEGVSFLDNMDGNARKTQSGAVVMTRATDNAYESTTTALEIVDAGLRRRVRIEKKNSVTTVAWNPWAEGAKAMADMGDEEWREFVCVEACNILDYTVELAGGATHTMEAKISVHAYEPA